MNSVKDFDMPKELAKYNWDQVKNMMDLYNEKKPQQKIIEKDFKQIFDIYKSYVVNLPKIVVNSNETESFTTVENQKVSEFSISEQQKQKIS
ncbi:TPA: hypothetical protein DEP21_04095 [Patescibacteria group bacterium]|nr:hypothetical protein [Candidatus Gracilibacteria bacterium]